MIENKKILVTGGAGFIGSNLCESLLKNGNKVICLDNFTTGNPENVYPFLSNKNFRLIIGDIRCMDDCRKACESVDYILHEAALGSVPRSIKDPLTSNEVNVSGFLNMLVAARDAQVKRFVYAASSSAYGDSKVLPKVEEHIGKLLSPYAVTKYVNELYADVFSQTYGMECIGLRYFNVFGRRQDPNSIYAAVIPKFVVQLIKHRSPVINGDGEYSRDFTYIENVILANLLALEAPEEAVNMVYNVACGERTSLNQLFGYLKEYLSVYDKAIACIEAVYENIRPGDIPHSLASIEKAKQQLGYNPKYNVKAGLQEAVKWYYKEFKELKI
jgi:UDP-N-acetylglucosamine 4-epimerase